MNSRETERLLEKFYEGETTLQEEQQLYDFFRSGEVPRHLADQKQIFDFFTESRKESIPDPNFDRKVEERLTGPRIIRMSSRRQAWTLAAGIAATVLLVFGLFFVFHDQVKRNEISRQAPGTVTDPGSAFRDAHSTLVFVSVCFNNGIGQIQRLEAFDRGLKQVERISIFNDYSNLIINPDGTRSPSQKHR